VLPFLVCLNFLLVNFIEYSFKSFQTSTPFAVVLDFKFEFCCFKTCLSSL